MNPADYTRLELLVADTAVQVRKLRAQLPLIRGLATTRGHDRTYIAPGTLELMGRQHAESRRDRRLLEIASNAQIPVRESRVPLDLTLSAFTTEVEATLRHSIRRLLRWHATRTTQHRPLTRGTIVTGFTDPVPLPSALLALYLPNLIDARLEELADGLYELLWTVEAPGLIQGIDSDVLTLITRATRLIDGEDRKRFPGHCPWCGLESLVVYVEGGVIRCERQRDHDGERPRCRCTDSGCSCHLDPMYVHSWLRETREGATDSWATLARQIQTRTKEPS